MGIQHGVNEEEGIAQRVSLLRSVRDPHAVAWGCSEEGGETLNQEAGEGPWARAGIGPPLWGQ